ncbi:MAG: transcription-repair coupling factor [Candidatus Aminicenantes bacterium]|nr:transcription-repair coupling factor [Candidatus Aminicenantes bacterium]
MINKIFSSQFIQGLKSAKTRHINNVDRNLIELYVAGIFHQCRSHLIWMVGENEHFQAKEKKLRSWLELLGLKEVPIDYYKLPFEDPFVNSDVDLDALDHKLRLISNLLKSNSGIIVTTLSALSIKIEEESRLERFIRWVKLEDRFSRNDFLSAMIESGYKTRDFVEQPGDISWRGSIVDIFSVNEDNPVRIEVLGGAVKSIRYFDIQTQRSIRTISQIQIPIARYFLNFQSMDQYFRGDHTRMKYLPDLLKNHCLVASDFDHLNSEFGMLLENFNKIRVLTRIPRKRQQKPEDIFTYQPDEKTILSLNEIFDDIFEKPELVKLKKSVLEFNQDDINRIADKIKNEYSCYLCSENKKIMEHVVDFWGDVHHLNFNLPFSFENRANRTLFLTFKNFYFEQKEIRVENEAEKIDRLLKEIKTDDFVVHKKHGIGKYLGLRRLQFGGMISEFLQIEYLNKEFLYVPVYELDVLSRYVAPEGYHPPLDKMGGKTWESKQSRVKKSIVTFARDLLELYAVRKSIKGHSYPKPDDMENKLWEGFSYLETRDQFRAIKDVMNDLEADSPMDRLVCGDVSFGKTEVAIRAAFRVILNGKQVVVLCPTTILAWQHFETFRQRFSVFPVRIALLSRMVSTQEKKRVLEELKTGKVDVVIGTHALISRDIRFRDLGLVIIDEEQRFGVFQKEKLKKNREDIDVLSLSATPIPRTLSLSLSGLQDLSVIQSPPIGRLAVKNYVGNFSKEIIMSAVLNEIERDGLVFIVYNNIEKIYQFRDQLQSWLPEVRMTLIHSKMRSDQIENNLMSFIQKRYRILVSTTIIENGIDIPDVNTMIVVNADRFGLTQLYQLRGRIGRSSRQAYAFFLVRNKPVSDRARSRLNAIRDFADLGSGYKLAEFDLKLRGMGSLLGNKQHGHIEALGFDYYLELLNQLIKELKGEEEKEWQYGININFSYSIDSEYISDAPERIRTYKKILEASSLEDLVELWNELVDRFGPCHISVEKVFLVALIRIVARLFRFKEVEIFEDRVEIGLSEPDTDPGWVNLSFLKKIRYEKLNTHRYVWYITDFAHLVNHICHSS